MKKTSVPPRHAIDISEEAGVRTAFGSDWVQGAMRIARPWSLELAYTREMMAGLLLRPPSAWPRTALLVGPAPVHGKFIRYRPVATHRSRSTRRSTTFASISLPDDPQQLDVRIPAGPTC
jgi:hypothetical protein